MWGDNGGRPRVADLRPPAAREARASDEHPGNERRTSLGDRRHRRRLRPVGPIPIVYLRASNAGTVIDRTGREVGFAGAYGEHLVHKVGRASPLLSLPPSDEQPRRP